MPSFFSAIKAQAWVESSIFCLIQWHRDFKFGFKLKGSVVFFIYFQCQSWPIVMSGMDLIGIAQVRNSTVKPRLTATSVIRSPRYYGHFFGRLAKTALHFLVKFNSIRVVKKILSCGRFRKSRWLWEMDPLPPSPPQPPTGKGSMVTVEQALPMWKRNNQHVMSMEQKKIWVPDRIRTYDLPNTRRVLHPLELRRTHGERGHILGWYSTLVLHTARISNVDVLDFVNKSNLFDTE